MDKSEEARLLEQIRTTKDREARRLLEDQLDHLRGRVCAVCGTHVADGDYHNCSEGANSGGY